MKCLDRNKRPLYYALYTGKTEVTDSYGNATGEYHETYSEPVLLNINQSGGRGDLESDLFGADVVYSKTIVTTDMACPIDEYSVIWIDKDPTKDPYNYVVAAPPAKTLNSITIALREVDVKHDPIIVNNG